MGSSAEALLKLADLVDPFRSFAKELSRPLSGPSHTDLKAYLSLFSKNASVSRVDAQAALDVADVIADHEHLRDFAVDAATLRAEAIKGSPSLASESLVTRMSQDVVVGPHVIYSAIALYEVLHVRGVFVPTAYAVACKAQACANVQRRASSLTLLCPIIMASPECGKEYLAFVDKSAKDPDYFVRVHTQEPLVVIAQACPDLARPAMLTAFDMAQDSAMVLDLHVDVRYAPGAERSPQDSYHLRIPKDPVAANAYVAGFKTLLGEVCRGRKVSAIEVERLSLGEECYGEMPLWIPRDAEAGGKSLASQIYKQRSGFFDKVYESACETMKRIAAIRPDLVDEAIELLSHTSDFPSIEQQRMRTVEQIKATAASQNKPCAAFCPLTCG